MNYTKSQIDKIMELLEKQSAKYEDDFFEKSGQFKDELSYKGYVEFNHSGNQCELKINSKIGEYGIYDYTQDMTIDFDKDYYYLKVTYRPETIDDYDNECDETFDYSYDSLLDLLKGISEAGGLIYDFCYHHSNFASYVQEISIE